MDRAIARFRVRLMNDTKWREVLGLLRTSAPEIKRVRLKFVDSEVVSESTGRFVPMTPSWCDGFPGPFQYRELEWMEVPVEYSVSHGNQGTPLEVRRQDVGGYRALLHGLGQLRIVDTDNGFRLMGYE